jgi:hypothetical protein
MKASSYINGRIHACLVLCFCYRIFLKCKPFLVRTFWGLSSFLVVLNCLPNPNLEPSRDILTNFFFGVVGGRGWHRVSLVLS